MAQVRKSLLSGLRHGTMPIPAPTLLRAPSSSTAVAMILARGMSWESWYLRLQEALKSLRRRRSDRDEAALMMTETSHRPWELPRRPWMLAMRWHDLLFMHWPVPHAALRALIPSALALETFDGNAWVGVVPFRMTGVRPRVLPALHWLSAFPELNVRTYVTVGGKPGVWFFSLDATNPLAVRLARSFFYLPYYDARMALKRCGDHLHYTSDRTHRGAPPAAFHAQYQPIGPVSYAAPGTLAHWLTERYCLYAADQRGRVWRGDIHHARWPLQPAAADVHVNTMTYQIGLTLPDTPPLLHFARRLDVVGWLPERV